MLTLRILDRLLDLDLGIGVFVHLGLKSAIRYFHALTNGLASKVPAFD